MAFCSGCGQTLTDGSSFCAGCGRRIATAESVPAASVSVVAAPAPEAAGLSDNVAGLLAYFLLPAVIFLIVEPFKRNRFVRFHSFQCVYFVAVWFVLSVVLGIVGSMATVTPMIGGAFFFLDQLVGLAGMLIGIYLMYNAYRGKKVQLPVVGKMAEKQADAI